MEIYIYLIGAIFCTAAASAALTNAVFWYKDNIFDDRLILSAIVFIIFAILAAVGFMEVV